MAETPQDVIRRYLEDALAAENSFETQLRSFASETDDDNEARQLFAEHADQTRTQISRLERRLGELGGSPSTGKSALSHIFGLAPKSAQIPHTMEERLVQNLMMAYTVEAAECAMYQALAASAEATGDTATASLAREIQKEEYATGNKFWALIPSRSIIAYNMLTIDEVDPSVETKLGEASWTS